MHWIVGDIHGMLKPLELTLEAVKAADSAAVLVFVGDYVNRGPDSRGVIELLRKLPGAHFVRGNHDDVFDLILHGVSIAPELLGGNRLAAFTWFSHHGLWDTLMSYGADAASLQTAADHPNDILLDVICEVVPAEHRAFVRGLPLAAEFDDFFVVHALWPADEPTEEPGVSHRIAASVRRREGALWGRYTRQEIDAAKAWKRSGYFGHTPVDAYHEHWRPVIGNRMILLDTAAALSANGRLTAYCHESGQYIQADRLGRVKSGSLGKGHA